jgi:uncharacterized protein (TIGR03032 family)
VKVEERRHQAAWARHDHALRDPRQIAGMWEGAAEDCRALLRMRATGGWWDLLGRLGITLIVTREYEHLVMALGAGPHGPKVSYMRLPHPSGIVVDREREALWIACTRLPNQVFEFRPASARWPRIDRPSGPVEGRPLVPVRSRFHPGCLYLHDLALIDGGLYGAAAGMNAVVRLDRGPVRPLWWPAAVERRGRPDHRANYIQLNSIAAGASLSRSFFTASSERILDRRPGDPAFPVDRLGVVFSGETREPLARGLTRPHSARLHQGRVWVDDSGYGGLSVVEKGAVRTVTRLPGWTRGLCFCGGVAFVGTSRVIPRFRCYAPGLRVDESVCGVHAVDAASGRTLGSCRWPAGNQIFGIDWVSSKVSSGFPFTGGRPAADEELHALFYGFRTGDKEE